MDTKTMLVLSSMLPFEEIVKEMTKALDEYKENPTEVNKKKIGMWSTVAISNLVSKGTMTGAHQVIKDMEKEEKMVFKPSDN